MITLSILFLVKKIHLCVLVDDIVSPLDVLEELNSLARRNGLCEFWLKKSIMSDEENPDEGKYHFVKKKTLNLYIVIGWWA